MNKKEKPHVPFIATSEETTEKNKTGDQAIEVPCLSNKISPCQNACPIGQNIPEILRLVAQGEFEQAWRLLARRNPFVGSTASVCQGFCQKECNRKEFDDFVAFNKVEKFLGKMAIKQRWSTLEELIGLQKEIIAIIGSGPAGLACAYQLARKGYWVHIFESLSVFGGLMRTAIPKDRLPRNVLEAEIKRNIFCLPTIIASLNSPVDEKRFTEIRKDFDAVFVAIGEHKPIKLGIENEGSDGVVYGLDFLKKFNLNEQCDVGRRVTIVGSGNTAIDCALCAVKIPDTKVFVFCEKEWEEIPDFLQKGIKAAKKKRVIFFFGVKVKGIEKNKAGIKRVNFTEVKQDVGKGEFTLCRNTDTLIVALGEERDPSFVPKYFAPRIANVFLGGNPKNVASAIASGNEGAREIIDYLQGEKTSNRVKKSPEIIEFGDLNMAYFKESPRNKKILDEEIAKKEAGRCLNCGTCIGCKICWQYCPDFSVEIQEGEPPKFDEEHCKGCGICANECPRGVIKMKKEEKQK